MPFDFKPNTFINQIHHGKELWSLLALFVKSGHTFPGSILEKSRVIPCLPLLLWSVFLTSPDLKRLLTMFQYLATYFSELGGLQNHMYICVHVVCVLEGSGGGVLMIRSGKSIKSELPTVVPKLCRLKPSQGLLVHTKLDIHRYKYSSSQLRWIFL